MDNYGKQEKKWNWDKKDLKKVGKTQRRVRVDKYEKKNRENTERDDWEEKKESERGTSIHMKERFFYRLAVAATQYFNMLLDPDRPGLAVYVCVFQCVSAVCSPLSYNDKLLSVLIWSKRLLIPHYTAWVCDSGKCTAVKYHQLVEHMCMESKYVRVCVAHG